MNNFELIKNTISKCPFDVSALCLAKFIEITQKKKLKDYEDIMYWLLQEVEE